MIPKEINCPVFNSIPVNEVCPKNGFLREHKGCLRCDYRESVTVEADIASVDHGYFNWSIKTSVDDSPSERT